MNLLVITLYVTHSLGFILEDLIYSSCFKCYDIT